MTRDSCVDATKKGVVHMLRVLTLILLSGWTR